MVEHSPETVPTPPGTPNDELQPQARMGMLILGVTFFGLVLQVLGELLAALFR